MDLASLRLGLIPIVVLAASIILLLIFNATSPVFNPPYLLLILNGIFITGTHLVVSFICAKTYLKHGLPNTLLLGSALIISGLVSIIAGLTANISANYAVTVFNVGMLAFSILQLLSATISSSMLTTTANNKSKLFAAYGAVIVFVAFLATVSSLGVIPVFFTATGPTLIRQIIIGLAIFLLAVGSLAFGWRYIQSRSAGLYWHSLGLAILAVGLVSVGVPNPIGDIYNWLGRLAQYVGGIYFLLALLSIKRSAMQGGVSDRWAETFRTDRKQISALFANMTEGFALSKIIYDSKDEPVDYITVEVNEAWEKFTGLKKEVAVGKKITQIIPGIEKDSFDWIGKYGKVAKTGEPAKFEAFFQPFGRWYSVIVYSPKKDYFVAIFHDITEGKIAEEKLEQYNRNLEQLVEERTKQLKDSERLAAIGATAGMVGHDIRNPLQAITGDLYLVKTELDELPDHQQKKNAMESLGEIQNNIDYINKIVADLQDYARPLDPRAQEANLKAIFNEILTKNGIPKNIKSEVKLEEKAEKIMADPDYLKRIAANLTLNAVQAMPNGGKLTIHAFIDKQTNDTLITVKDTGVGIPEDVKPKLFTPMMTTKSKGQGFGLAVVKRMTEGLGGTVTFESEEGKGTTFTVRLPPPKS